MKDSSDKDSKNADSIKAESTKPKSANEKSSQAESTLALIYQALSPATLLKAKRFDANTLKKPFYDELLYILGLKEESEGGSIKIVSSDTENSLCDTICKTFTLNPSDEKEFDRAFSFLITFSNRILFLRLLESMLLGFKHIDKPFLDIETLSDFKALGTLFFDVLAKDYGVRKDIPKVLDSIPYLNSSLFERTHLERDISEGKDEKYYGYKVENLDSKPMTIFKHSVLKKHTQEQLPLLEYLFLFLKAYDFTTTPSDIQNRVKTNYDKLINAAVLGLVFEKLNGYKEGSFYTPSFITNYMCEESIKKIVLDKFRDNGYQATNLKDLYNEIRDIKRAKEIFLSIKVCDPSVGSGHFLVSALNQMILIQSELGLLLDSEGKRLVDCKMELQNDEILIKNSEGKLHTYEIPKADYLQSHQIQKSIFNAKKEIIESCLFGVDINNTSCEITKLRLWIELLKYSFYKDIDKRHLETLPNIDINIKCGNSLISHIDLNTTKDKLSSELKERANNASSLENQVEFTTAVNALNKLPKWIESYRKAVNDYKNETRQEFKQLDKATIKKCKKDILDIFHITSEEYKNFKGTFADYLTKYGYYGIDEAKIGQKELDSDIKKKLNKHLINFNFHKDLDIPKDSSSYVEKELKAVIDSMQKYEYLKNDKNAFEWRFEFPEVLDNEGNFKGFDIVIGNPPYIDYRKIDGQTKLFLDKNSMIYKQNKEGSIYVYFIEKSKEILSQNGNIIFINPIAYICQDSGAGLRNFIDKNFTLIQMINVSNLKVFKSAATYTCINHFIYKNENIKNIEFGEAKNENLSTIQIKKIKQTNIENISTLLNPINTKIFNENYPQLRDFCQIFCGLSKTGFRKSVKSKQNRLDFPFLESSDIFRYSLKYGKFLSNISFYYSQDRVDIFKNSDIIFMARMTNFIRCCIAPKGYFGGKVNILYNFKIDKKYILGILNSKLMSYFYKEKYFASHMQGGAFGFDTQSVGNLPIPKITSKNKKLTDEIIGLVDKVIMIKGKNAEADTSEFEKQIDSAVYRLYGLSDEEIRIVEHK